jgi:hypothetical protein
MANGNDNGSSCAAPGWVNPFGSGPGGGNMHEDTTNVTDLVEEHPVNEGDLGGGAAVSITDAALQYFGDPEPDFAELLRFDYNFFVGKNKWIFEPHLLAGVAINPDVFVYPLVQDPRHENACPPNIPSPTMRTATGFGVAAGGLDTFRFATGKFWMNLAHGAGPREGLNFFLEKRRTPDGPMGLLSFHNPGPELSKGKHYLALVTPEELAEGRVMPVDDWLGGISIRARLTTGVSNTLELPIYHEPLKIVFPPPPLRIAATEGPFGSRFEGAPARPANEGAGPPENDGGPDCAWPNICNDNTDDVLGERAVADGGGGMELGQADDTEKEILDEGRESVGEVEERRQGGEILTQNWNWRNYMYGLNADGAMLEGIPQAVNLQRHRLAALVPENQEWHHNKPASRLLWNDWRTAEFSKNLFPVIPFYGASQELAFLQPEVWFDEDYRPPRTGNNVFFDHVTNTPAFMTKTELNQTDIRSSQYWDAAGSYNFYDCIYEDLITPMYGEARLPNFYRMRPENYARSELSEEEYRERYGWWLAQNEEQRANREEMIARRAIEKYGVFDPRDYPSVRYWDIFENTNLPNYRKIYDERGSHPMHTELEFTSNSTSLIADAMRLGPDRSAMYELLLPFASANDQNTTNLVINDILGDHPLVTTETSETVSQFAGVGGDRSDESSRATNAVGDTAEEQTKVMELSIWLKWLETAMKTDTARPLEQARQVFDYMTIKTNIRKVIEAKYRRRFTDVLGGMPAYSEVLAYRVEKTGPGFRPQNYYFGTDNEVDIVKYIDSQVEYGKRYTYKIYQTIIVVGTEYAYSDCMSIGSVRRFFRETEHPQTENASMFFGVIHTPSVKIIEIPMGEREIVILDRPPMPPEVNVIPFKGDANRVLFNLNSGTGQLYAPPIILEDDDNVQFSNVALNQRATFDPESWLPPGGEAEPDEVIHFKNDDQTKIFEVFRLEDEPTSWQDFYDKKVARVVNTATNGSFEDVIRPNKKYYYTFRAEDNHGHVSNPTHIYQVEMVKNSETVYMKMDLFSFKEPVDQRTKTFSKKIQIQPSFLQRLLPLPISSMFSDWEAEGQVGNSSNPVWGKKFKFRITSKSTGKQFDLNFKFVKKYARIPEEVQNTVHNSDKC